MRDLRLVDERYYRAFTMAFAVIAAALNGHMPRGIGIFNRIRAGIDIPIPVKTVKWIGDNGIRLREMA